MHRPTPYCRTAQPHLSELHIPKPLVDSGMDLVNRAKQASVCYSVALKINYRDFQKLPGVLCTILLEGHKSSLINRACSLLRLQLLSLPPTAELISRDYIIAFKGKALGQGHVIPAFLLKRTGYLGAV